VIRAGGAVAICASALYFAASGRGIDATLYAARFFSGLAEGILFPAFFTYAADVIPEEKRAQGIAWFGISGMLPMSLAPALGEKIVAWGGFPALFVASTAAAGASLLLSLAMRESRPGTCTDFAPGGGKALRNRYVSPVFGLLVEPSLVPVWILAAVFGVGLTATQVFVAPAVKEATGGEAGLYFAVYGVTAVALRLFAGGVPDRYGHSRVAAPSLLAYAASIAVLAVSRESWALVLAAVLGGVGHGYLFPSASALAINRTPAHARGAAMSVLTGVLDGVLLVAAPALGWTGDRGGPVWLFGAALIAVLAGGALWLWRERALARPAGAQAAAEAEL
jgi:MFS family permease